MLATRKVKVPSGPDSAGAGASAAAAQRPGGAAAAVCAAARLGQVGYRRRCPTALCRDRLPRLGKTTPVSSSTLSSAVLLDGGGSSLVEAAQIMVAVEAPPLVSVVCGSVISDFFAFNCRAEALVFRPGITIVGAPIWWCSGRCV